MSRQTHPVYLTILNIWGGKSTIFIGYIPHKAYNIDVLEDLLTKNKKININSLKDEIISLLGPSDMMHFYDTVLEPLFRYLNGIVFQVGRGEDREIRRFFPFLVVTTENSPSTTPIHNDQQISVIVIKKRFDHFYEGPHRRETVTNHAFADFYSLLTERQNGVKQCRMERIDR
jgi:hypothetical protein